MCRAYSEGSKLIIANSCDCLRKQARTRKNAVGYPRLVVRDVCLDHRHRFPPYSQQDFRMPLKNVWSATGQFLLMCRQISCYR
jgi:hypothetical protein